MVSHCIVLNFTVLHGIALYHCWLRRAGCISQDTYLLYYVIENFIAFCLKRKEDQIYQPHLHH